MRTSAFLSSGLVGASSGLFVFLLETSARLIYGYFWTAERAPVGYLGVMAGYLLFGLLLGLAFPFAKLLPKSIGRHGTALKRAGIAIAFLAAVAALLLLTRVVDRERVPPKLLQNALAVALVGAAFLAVSWALARWLRRLGAPRFVLGCAAVASIFFAGHAMLVRALSWDRVLARLPPPDAARARPNVLLLTIDTLRADRLGAYGYAAGRSPHIDRLASEGALFEGAMAQSPWTRPSFASMLTSTYPSQHGAFIVNDPRKAVHTKGKDKLYDSGLGDEATTLAEVLRDHGYTAVGIQSNWHASEAQNFDQGFHLFLYEALYAVPWWERSVLGSVARLLPALVGREPTPPFYTSPPDADAVYDAFRALVTRGPRQPFFIWINFLDPHSPYLARKEGLPIEAAPVTTSYDTWDPDTPTAVLSATYDVEIEYVDHYVGKLLDLMTERGLLDDTVVLFSSDHGESFDDHSAEIRLNEGLTVRGRHHGHSLYNELLRVPLLIRYPPLVPPGLRIEERVAVIDYLPTILEMAGITHGLSALELEGRSLLPLMRADGAAADSPPVFSERMYFGTEKKAIQDGHLKLILDVERGRHELYDLELDPREREDVAELRPDDAERLRARLDEWMTRMGPLVPASGSARRELSEKEQERLRTLGYLE